MTEPLKLTPVLKDIIWGGRRLSSEYGMGKDNERIAEAWMLSDRSDGDNTLGDGTLLSEYLSSHPEALGKRAASGRFPLLIKLIDAEKDLSIQVHPDDEYAHAHTDDDGKTEFWYIVDAEKDARIVYGLKPGCTAKDLGDALKEGCPEKLMNYVPVKKGDSFFIPSGLVHAICGGVLIAEIQQNSNVTYRVYDYRRPGADGKPRALHIDDALAVVSRFKNEARAYSSGNTLVSCEYFNVLRFMGDDAEAEVTEESFRHLLCVSGTAVFTCGGRSYGIKKGDSYFLPAGAGKIGMSFGDGGCVLISGV